MKEKNEHSPAPRARTNPDDEATVSPSSGTRPRARGTEAIRVEGGEKRLGPYRILEEIGRGGMGVVYRAEHPELKRTVALKVMIAGEDASEEAVKRFHREAEAVAKLGHHPNIVPVYDIGAEQSVHYIAMHYVEGKPLDRLIDEGEVAPKRAAVLADKAACALQHAHDHGVLHRDIKPSNILVTGEGEPQITDFGLAKDVRSDSRVTVSGSTIGTPQYMPPEQADGRIAEIDARSDVYALGATLYEMLTLRPPFEGATVINVITRVMVEEPVAPRKKNPAVPRDLETICLKCLEKERDRRYETAKELAEDLDRFLDSEPIRARPPSLLYRLSRRVRRRPGVTLMGAVTAAALTALVLLWAFGASDGARWRQVFEQDFDGDALRGEWSVQEGEWSVEDGVLSGKAMKNADATLLFLPTFGPDVRVEYECWAGNPLFPGECSCILASRMPNGMWEGYYVAFGANNNSRSAVGVFGNVPKPPQRPRFENGNDEVVVTSARRTSPHRIRVERRGNRVSLFVDDFETPAVAYVDRDGSARPRAFSVGFYSYGSSVFFDRLRIFEWIPAGEVRERRRGIRYEVLNQRLKAGERETLVSAFERMADEGGPFSLQAAKDLALLECLGGNHDAALDRIRALSGRSSSDWKPPVKTFFHAALERLKNRHLDREYRTYLEAFVSLFPGQEKKALLGYAYLFARFLEGGAEADALAVGEKGFRICLGRYDEDRTEEMVGQYTLLLMRAGRAGEARKRLRSWEARHRVKASWNRAKYDAAYYRGNLEFAAGDRDGAMTDFMKALPWTGHPYRSRDALGGCLACGLADSALESRAEEAIRVAEEQFPKDRWMVVLSIWYVAHGEFERARDLLETLAERRGEAKVKPLAPCVLFLEEEDSGDFLEHRRALDAECCLFLAARREREGKGGDAAKLYRRCLDLPPSIVSMAKDHLIPLAAKRRLEALGK